MVIHKQTKLMPSRRRALAHDHFVGKLRKVDLMAKYGISFPTVPGSGQDVLGNRRLIVRDLRAKGYIEWTYSTHSAEKTKLAIYHLDLNDACYLRTLTKKNKDAKHTRPIRQKN